MLYEVAILPEAFDNTLHSVEIDSSVVLKTVLRDMGDNGLLSDLNESGWRENVLERTKTLPPKLRQDIVSAMTLLVQRNRVVMRPKSPVQIVRDDSWLDVATELDNLYAIIVNHLRDYPNRDAHLELRSVLDSEHWRGRRRTWGVSLDRIGYKSVLTPLLRYARKLLLIDPYLSPSAACKPVIELCAELLGHGSSSKKRSIHLHTSKVSGSVEASLEEWRQVLEPLRDRCGVSFCVYIYEIPKEGQRFHDRYLLTDQCGVSLPMSLQLLKGSETYWTLLDFEVANQHRVDFEAPIHPHLKLANKGSLTVKP